MGSENGNGVRAGMRKGGEVQIEKKSMHSHRKFSSKVGIKSNTLTRCWECSTEQMPPICLGKFGSSNLSRLHAVVLT